MSKPKKIDEAWEQLFEQYRILSHIDNDGVFRITADQINVVHQARLMAKFDRSALLPEIFRSNQLSILPDTKGTYLIGPFKTHEKIEYGITDPNIAKPSPVRVKLPTFLKTIDPLDLYSESAILSFAYNSGIIKDIMGDAEDVRFTVNGRMKSGSFSFFVENSRQSQNSIAVDVANSQIEIDAGFESPDLFVICEAKQKAPEELLIRQLYYPYRLWKEKIQKPVVPVFLTFSGDIFHVFIYEFTDDTIYNSIKLKEHREYMFAEEDILVQDILELWKTINTVPEPAVSFPQADSFPRILDLLSELHKGELLRSQVTMMCGFSSRQTNYYISACEYLGLVERVSISENQRKYRLTIEAKAIMTLPHKRKYLELIRKILERPVFYEAFAAVANGHGIPSRNEVCRIMRSVDFPIPMNDTTIGRRSSTVLGWLDWMLRIAVAD